MTRRGRLIARWGIALALATGVTGFWLTRNRVLEEARVERMRQRLAQGPGIGARRAEMESYLRQQQVDFRYIDAQRGEAEFDSEVDATGVPINEIGGIIQASQPADPENKASGGVIMSTLIFDRKDRLRTYRVKGFYTGP